MATLREDLMRPDAYPSPRPMAVECIETHISWVFRTDTEVFKVKRPVVFPFLDFSSPALRAQACSDEVALNARLAPGVYRGVVPVRRTADGMHHVGGEVGEVVDHAVCMTRLQDTSRADVLLETGALDGLAIDRLAAHLAQFHRTARADPATAAHGSIEAITRAVDENFVQSADLIAYFLTPEQALELSRWQRTFLAQHGLEVAARAAARKVREGHGDLRLEHVYVDERNGAFVILDCVEFSERLRCADVASDIAFLAMDLVWHRRVDLAERIVARYAREADDFDVYTVVDFYASYRAHVRAKITASGSVDPRADEATCRQAAASARRYFLLALAANRRSLLTPAVVAVGGVIASGKTHLAEALASELSAPVVEADRTRKAMFGVEPTTALEDGAWQGHYTPEASARVYDEVFRRAAVVLKSGRPVIIDASFRTAAARARARELAREYGVPFRFVECCAPADVCRERLRLRATTAGVSDGRLEVFDAFLASYEAVTELPALEHLAVDTTQPDAVTLARLRSAVDVWPPGLVA